MEKAYPITIDHIFISPGHNFYRHKLKQPGQHLIDDVDQVEAVAGKGLKGDRYYDYKENFKGQVTFFSMDVYRLLIDEMGFSHLTPDAFRRNVLISGINLNDLIGSKFFIGAIEFKGSEECSPCPWMDHSAGPGTKDFLLGRGGLRARILSSGTLSKGAHTLVTQAPLPYVNEPARPLSP